MSNDLAPTPELQTLVEQLGSRDSCLAAESALASRGEAGLAAAIWGLSHPNVRVRGGCAAFMDHHGCLQREHSRSGETTHAHRLP